MATDQRRHWNELHLQNKANLEEPTTFAKEVQNLLSTKIKLLELGCGSGADSYFQQFFTSFVSRHGKNPRKLIFINRHSSFFRFGLKRQSKLIN